ncbi:hypothetical protein [Botrimarina hoheduenensis]|uniref:Tetratricopeptide repeat protein n=1 Tax=Botrimarina hoheduenensis TaxID=2528000 RepID=A0A5C5WAP8_9BACT|nr:hypothetical protein [Botrimarina hoheduenensis]TWT47654.1 hypothetical protein Pla111_12720 [Botrimarina hoheduenensis]
MTSGRPHKKKASRSAGGKRRGGPNRPGTGNKTSQGPSGWRVTSTPEGAFALVAPPDIVEREDDINEVRLMIEAEETEIAADELRWLLADCPDHLTAHALLGEIAGGTGDLVLARAHFGYAFEIGLKTLAAAGCAGPLPGADLRNGAWHDAALGLAWALEKLGESRMADDVAATTLRMDSTDPAGVRAMLDDLRSGGLPMVSLG